MTFRPMTVDDLDALLPLQEAGAVAALSHIFPQDLYPFSRNEIAARWRAEIGDDEITTFVSTDDDRALTGFSATRGEELLHFGTAVATWGSGLAQQLHDATVATMPAGVTLHLHVFEENGRARRFYEKLGWMPTGAWKRSTFAPNPVLVEYALPPVKHP